MRYPAPVDRPPTWDHLNALFNEALEQDASAREAFLARLAEEDSALAGEVRSLLAAHQAASGFLAGSPAQNLSQTASPGDRFGPYRVLEEIGRGGMSVVFKAVRDDEHFTKEVAIKLLPPSLRSHELMHRFRAERQILAMLDHPAIARLIDGGTAPDGTPYLVMDFVSGQPLTQYCDAHRLGIDARLRIFLDVCDAVVFAHQRLVVHRDLKPDNILVTEDGQPKLLDFGIAKLLAPDETGPAVTITAPWGRLLTPDYASPEQIRGDPVTVTTDVYSLGVVLYELLAGRRPLEFRTRQPEEMLRVSAEEEPLPPSTAVTRSDPEETASRRSETTQRLRRNLSGDLDYIVLKALEKNPARRYGSVAELAEDIRRHLAGLPVLARGASTLYLASRFVRRHRAAVITASLVTLTLIAGLIGTTWQAAVARRERDRAERRFADVKSLAHAVVFDIHDGIVNLPGSTPARKVLVNEALKYLNSLSAEAKDDPALQHELGVAYGKIGDAEGRPDFPNLGQPREALESYRRSLSLLERAAQAAPESLDYARDLILTQQRLADLRQAEGHSEEAMDLATTALAGIERLRVKFPDNPLLPGDLILAHDRMGDWKLAAGDSAGATVERQFCMNFAEEMYRKDPGARWRRGIIVQCAKTAELLAARHERAAARASYERSLGAAKEAAAEQKDNTETLRDLSIVYSMFAMFSAQEGEIDSALTLYDQSMKISEDLAAQDPGNVLAAADVASGHLQMGTMLLEGSRYEAALVRFNEAFTRYAPLIAADTSNVGNRLAFAHSGRGAGEASEALYRAAPAAQRERFRMLAVDWFRKSRDVYEGLERQGALGGEDTQWPVKLAQRISELGSARS